jgi:Na+-translocating ferredoxin:NAD+ oxidoreductase RnfD subunit
LIQEDTSKQVTIAREESLMTEVKIEEKKRIGLPWWIWPVLILIAAIVLLVFLRKFKIPF